MLSIKYVLFEWRQMHRWFARNPPTRTSLQSIGCNNNRKEERNLTALHELCRAGAGCVHCAYRPQTNRATRPCQRRRFSIVRAHLSPMTMKMTMHTLKQTWNQIARRAIGHMGCSRATLQAPLRPSRRVAF